MKKKILIVEDEELIVNIIKNRLSKEVYDVDISFDGKEALYKIEKNDYDLITLDIMLPFIDGFSLCKTIREKSKRTLIIMVSAVSTQEFKTKGYEYGIDDYISKPFSAKELSLKIKSLLKRRDELSTLEIISSGILSLNDISKEIKVNNNNVNFTPSEYFLLSLFIKNKNRVYTRQELAQLIYDNYLGEIDDRGIDSHICNIRKKISQYEEKNLIKTVRGIGYKIDEN